MLSNMPVPDEAPRTNSAECIACLEELSNTAFSTTCRALVAKVLNNVDHHDTIAKEPEFVMAMLAATMFKLFTVDQQKRLFADAVAIHVQQAHAATPREWMSYFKFAEFWLNKNHPHTLKNIFADKSLVSQRLLDAIETVVAKL
jgi:hypothetical protein